MVTKDIKILMPSEIELVRLEGHRVIVRMLVTMPMPARGHMLLELEKDLRANGMPKAEVFLEPKGDLNALRRKLRGVQL